MHSQNKIRAEECKETRIKKKDQKEPSGGGSTKGIFFAKFKHQPVCPTLSIAQIELKIFFLQFLHAVIQLSDDWCYCEHHETTRHNEVTNKSFDLNKT